MKSSEQRKYNIGLVTIGGIGLVIGVIIIILLGSGFKDLERLKALEKLAVCPYKESTLSCPVTSACQVGLVKKMCQEREKGRHHHHGHHHHHHKDCDQFICVVENLADGSCCDRNDFCSVSNPLKTCQLGQCVSPNATDCKGYCTVLDNCSAIPLPFLSFAPQDLEQFCFGGVCYTLIGTVYPFDTPQEMFNLTTAAQREVANCQTGQLVPDLFGDEAYGAIFVWSCSMTSPDQVFYKKRDQEQDVTEAPTTAPGPFRYYNIPGVFSHAQYIVLNAELNAIINALVAAH